LSYRIDQDLVHWLDDAVEKSIRAGNVKAIKDRKDTAKLVDITEHLGAPAYVIVKANARDDSEFAEALVTVLDETMVAEYEEKRWSLGSKMAQQLAKLPAGFATRRENDVTETTEKPANDAKAKPANGAASVESGECLISYVGEQGVAYELVPQDQLKVRLIELVMDPEVESETLRAWRELPINIRVQVDVG